MGRRSGAGRGGGVRFDGGAGEDREATAGQGRPLPGHRFPESFCLLTGMEGPGLPPHWRAKAVAIPMAPEVESLNAAVATAITLYEWRRRFGPRENTGLCLKMPFADGH